MNLLQAIELDLPAGFTIREQIGSGATSLVYLASSDVTGERLIVKVLRPGSTDPRAATRFYQVDIALQRLCETLREIGKPLSELLRKLQ